MTKEAEKRVRDLTNHYGWHRRKYGDVRYCIHCHKPLPKSENAPDFYISQIGDWVEAKNNDNTGIWTCAELYTGGERENQRRFLQQNDGWLFIELSDGRAPANAAAYLVPWDMWESKIETFLVKQRMKSIRRESTYLNCGKIKRYGADKLLKDYELKWEANIGWVIPNKHIYWYKLKDKLKQTLTEVERKIDGDTEH